MARHLSKHNVQALSPAVRGHVFDVRDGNQKRAIPQHAPSTLALHSLSARLARRLLGSYKIHTPELNAAPMLWRVVRALGGSREWHACLMEDEYDFAKGMCHVF
jgi:hypothetical protein